MMHTRRAVLASLAAAAPVAALAQPPSLGWTAAPELPAAAQEIYAAVDERAIYTAGGLQGRGRGPFRVLDAFSRFDLSTARWSQPATLGLPFARHHPQLAVAHGRVWVIGGFRETAAGQWTSITDVLSASPDAPQGGWTPGPPLPGPQSEAVTLVHAGRVHVIGGRSPSGQANGRWTDQADVATHRVLAHARGGARWSDARPAPTARNSAAGAVIDGALYVVGGRTVGGGNLATLERYDPQADRWDALRPMPQASGGLAAAAWNGRLYAFGGEWFDANGGGVYRECWAYDPRADGWTAAPVMRTPRHGLAAVAVQHGPAAGVYAIGGAVTASAAGASAVMERLRGLA